VVAAFPSSDEKTENSKIRIMINKKELKSNHSKLIQKLAWVLILTIGIINFGCQCDCEDATDEYYVKYEVISTTARNTSTFYATVNNEKNNDLNYSFAGGSQWETIIGPVQKGFTASIGARVEDYELGRVLEEFALNIYVSKNNGPFTIKALDTTVLLRDSGQNSYTIDY
jgi:hypothetical protein